VQRVRLARPAAADIRALLEWSALAFGEAAAARYDRLIERALYNIATDPDRPGVRRRDDLGVGTRTYHLVHASGRTKKAVDRVRRPRHLLIFRVAGDGNLDIGRVLHDAMDIEQHVPVDFRLAPDEGGAKG
jgi:toxin ParE1/3/4